MRLARYLLALACLVSAACGDGGDSQSTTLSSPPPTPTITTASLSATQRLLDYTQTVQATGGSNAGYVWSVINGALPLGITLRSGSPKATLSGTPTQVGVFQFTLQVQDSDGKLGVRDLAIEVTEGPLFQYELWMQAQTSLDMGPITIHGRVVNSGEVSINLTPQTTSTLGGPSNLLSTTCESPCVRQQLSGLVLAPGGQVSFSWLSGTQTENLTGFSGSLYSASIGLIPLGSDWTWTHAGNVPEILVNSEWVNGPPNMALPFNKRIISLATAEQFINAPNPAP